MTAAANGPTGATVSHHDHSLGPSGTGTVVLDIGGDTGALVIHTGPECHGLEIEISRAGVPGAPRTHAAVRERHLPHGVLHCAVLPGVPAGEYVVWRDATTPAGTVAIDGASVTEFHWTPG
jgi:hypothetical protein